jgi:hypothetical protein
VAIGFAPAIASSPSRFSAVFITSTVLNHGLSERLRRASLIFAEDRRVTLPVVRLRTDDDALHRVRRVVAVAACRLAFVFGRYDDCPGVRIEEQFGRIEASAAGRIERPMHAVPVYLTRPHARHEDVPVVITAVRGALDGNDSSRTGVVLSIEEEQVDGRVKTD